MRKVNKAAVAIPGVLTSAACNADIALIIATPGRKAKSEIYRGQVVASNGKKTFLVADALKALYDAKCAYCEKQCHDPEVEHFRPKGRVIGASPSPNGYYWLCYEWTNLVPSCHECNSVTAKGDKFPINGARVLTHPVAGVPLTYDPTQNVFTSAFLHGEDPLYIHPEYCMDFNVHFDFSIDGKMIGLTAQAKETVKDLKLDSDTLNGMRREIYKTYYNRLEKLVLRYKRPVMPKTEAWFDEEVFEFIDDLVKQSLDHTLQFTLFRQSLISKIGYYFIDPFDPVYYPDLNKHIARALTRIAV